MTERPGGTGGLSSGDPLSGGSAPEPPRHPSGLPGTAPGPERPAPVPGYGSPPPPGAGGPVAYQGPGDVMGRYALASWLSRVGAQLIDGAIIVAGGLVLFLPIAAALGLSLTSASDNEILAAIAAFIFWGLCIAVVACLYAPFMMARTNGKTLGRMAMNIRVVRTSGLSMTFGLAFVREIVIKIVVFRIAGTFTFGLAWLLDDLWPLWDEENRALHDFMVNTRVVRG
jgi:uncharacterized RDD family membrane protein YckC